MLFQFSGRGVHRELLWTEADNLLECSLKISWAHAGFRSQGFKGRGLFHHINPAARLYDFFQPLLLYRPIQRIAPFARSETGLPRLSRFVKKNNIFLFRYPGRTTGTAENTGRLHSINKGIISIMLPCYNSFPSRFGYSATFHLFPLPILL